MNYNNPQIGKHALAVCARNGIALSAVKQNCLRRKYPELVGWPEAKEIAAAVMHVSEFLFHLKAQNIGYRSRDMLRLMPGTTVKLVEKCCGRDGAWAMKKEFFLGER